MALRTTVFSWFAIAILFDVAGVICARSFYGPEAALRLAGPRIREGVGGRRHRRVLAMTPFGELA